jgi:hypothetical protein
LFDTILADSGITVVRCGVRVPRMNAITERWVRTCRRELLDRTLIFNQRHLLHALREYETFYIHRPHQGIGNARPLAPLPEPTTNPDRLARLRTVAMTASADSSTNTNVPPEQHGRNSRQVQRLRTRPAGVQRPHPQANSDHPPRPPRQSKDTDTHATGTA